MQGDRLAFALFPIAVMCGIMALEADQRRLAWGLACGVVLGAIFLLHPFHVVAPWLAVLVYWLMRVRSVPASEWARRALVGLGLPVLVTLGLTAWWFLPLMAHNSFATPSLRANIDGFLYWLQAGQFPLYAVLALTSLLALRQPGRPRALVVALIALPVMLVAFIIFCYVVLIDQLGFYTLDPIRFIDEVYFAILLLAAIGLGSLVQIADRGPRASHLTFYVSRIALLALVFVMAISLWTGLAQFRAGSQPRFLSQANEQYRLPELWTELQREPDGRVLVTSSQVHFHDEAPGGVEDWPSYLMTTIPVWTGRETIGGTFHHWTPTALTYWYGEERPAVMRELTHLLDDQRLFGHSWDQMDDAWLHEMCRRLYVTTILCADDDVNARGFLDRSPLFQSYWNNGKFFLYRVVDYSPAVLSYDPAQLSAQVLERTGTRLVIRVDRAEAGAQLGVKITAYPLWQATAQGQPTTITADALGLMHLTVPAGADYSVELAYRDGPAELTGAALTLCSMVVVLAGWVWSARRQN
ncbi:MAG: hypothetical protein KKA73_16960 [Chloroflexi bacterium]|nr:hypothetical protein [Chloroflexota bacterium]